MVPFRTQITTDHIGALVCCFADAVQFYAFWVFGLLNIFFRWRYISRLSLRFGLGRFLAFFAGSLLWCEGLSLKWSCTAISYAIFLRNSLFQGFFIINIVVVMIFVLGPPKPKTNAAVRVLVAVGFLLESHLEHELFVPLPSVLQRVLILTFWPLSIAVISKQEKGFLLFGQLDFLPVEVCQHLVGVLDLINECEYFQAGGKNYLEMDIKVSL